MIRDATAEDWPAIWPIFAPIVRAADTFSYDPAIGQDEIELHRAEAGLARPAQRVRRPAL